MPEHVLGLAPRLQDHGWEAEVTGPASSPWLAALRDAGVSVHGLPFARAPGPRGLGAAHALRALDRSRGYTIVHTRDSMAGVGDSFAARSRYNVMEAVCTASMTSTTPTPWTKTAACSGPSAAHKPACYSLSV